MLRHIIITFAVAMLTNFSIVSQPRRIAYPKALDANSVTLIAEQPQSRSANAPAAVNAMVEFTTGADCESLSDRYNFRINVRTGNLATILIPIDSLTVFAAHPDVISVSAGSSVRPMCDQATVLTGADKAHDGRTPSGTAYNGKGVIVGIIDSGFDFLHSAFRNASGQCRISTVWNQNRSASTVGTPSPFGYGIVLDTPADIEAAAHDYSGDTHGTHVAAIAVSSAGSYGGMAPDAEIALVSTNRSEAGIIDGLSYLLDYAEAKGKPLAVNISMGTVIGHKDGSDNLALMMDRLLDGRQGQLVAIAAGNEGHRRSTIVRDISAADEPISTRLTLPSYNRENLFAASASGKFTLTLSLHAADGSELFRADIPSDATESVRYDDLTGSNDGSFLATSATTVDDASPAVRANLYCPMSEGLYWQATVNGTPDRYILTSDYGELSEGSTATTIACSACGKNTISVGAFVSRTSYTNLDGTECDNGWDLGEEYPLSGKGPTFDGREAPAILAPGASVISAISSYTSQFSFSRNDLTDSKQSAWVENHTDFWGVMNGTSMATPVVTGILALWLQADPSLSADRVHTLLDGMDKIDAIAGLAAITSGIDLPAADTADRTGDIYDLSGRRLLNNADPATAGIAPGIYIVRTASGAYKYIAR